MAVIKNGLELENFRELHDALGEFGEKIRKHAMKRGLKKGAARLETYLKRAEPREDTGLLKASFRVTKSSRFPIYWLNYRWPSDNRKSYFGQVEKDTKFFWSTVNRHSKEIENIIKDGVKESLEFTAKAYAKKIK